MEDRVVELDDTEQLDSLSLLGSIVDDDDVVRYAKLLIDLGDSLNTTIQGIASDISTKKDEIDTLSQAKEAISMDLAISRDDNAVLKSAALANHRQITALTVANTELNERIQQLNERVQQLETFINAMSGQYQEILQEKTSTYIQEIDDLKIDLKTAFAKVRAHNDEYRLIVTGLGKLESNMSGLMTRISAVAKM